LPLIAPGQTAGEYIINQFPAIVFTKSIEPIDTKGRGPERIKIEQVKINLTLIAHAASGDLIDQLAAHCRTALMSQYNTTIASYQLSNINFIGQDFEAYDPDTELITINQLYSVHVSYA
jgi:hypothetical protein